jgi:hypothetical protein
MNQEKKVVKISDIVENQIPEFILSENPNFVEFFKQYYISQEFQGSTIDIAENLISYKNLDSFDLTNLISETTLTSNVQFFDDVINVESTNGWPKEYGLLKIDDEIITYTGITSTSFTGCIRGFSGTSSLTEENNPEFLVFSETETSEHSSGSIVENLSNLFLKEFFKKIKYQFTPGFEEIEFDSQINVQNFVSKARTFYQTKGTDEAFKILFKVLYAEDVKIIKPFERCFTTSDDQWRVVETFVCELVSGNPLNINGQTLYQDNFPQYNISKANGSIYDVESFSIDNKSYYKVQIFSGYSNNLNPKGSIEGTFVSTPKTFSVEHVSVGSTILTVDSTVGFGNTGTLEIGNLTIDYTDKTNNQFLGISTTAITSGISTGSKIFSDHFIYAYEENSNDVVKFKLCNVLSGLNDSDVLYAYDGDPILIDHLGSTEESTFLNSFAYNNPITISCGVCVNNITTEIRNNQQEGFSVLTGTGLCKYPHKLKTGDLVDLYLRNTNQVIAKDILVNVLNSKEFTVSAISISQQYGESLTNLLNKEILFKRQVKKTPYNNLNLTANIQDSYVDDDSYYVTSNGFPEYQIAPLTFDRVFSILNENTLETTQNHYYQIGDEVSVVSYQTSSEFENKIGIKTGTSYFVNRINGFQINLTEARENIESSEYVNYFEYDEDNNISAQIQSITLIPTSLYNESNLDIQSNKLFKKFKKIPEQSLIKTETSPGNIGVFVNGIELKNYKSFDKIYYGPIESVTVLNSGYDYNLLNPPQFEIEGTTYSDTEIIPQLKGSLVNIVVTDPGFDYVETPTVRILGGNNTSVVTEVKMKNVTNEVAFNATTLSTVVDTVNDKLKFGTPHRFVVGEPIIYKTFGTTPIGIGTAPSDGFLSDGSVYYAANIGAGTSISLAFTKQDALNNQNLINLRTYGGGFQRFVSTLKKKGIDEINIIQNEGEFEYKKVSFISEDVDTQDNIITIENHGFLTGDEVAYTWEPISGFNGQSIGGLSENVYYYVVKLDDDRLKLSSTKDEVNYVDLTSTEDYSIYFLQYSPIRVEISGSTSVNGLSQLGYSAEISFAVKGKVIGARIKRTPSIRTDKFGNLSILNYEKYPKVNVIKGSGASFATLVEDGQIKDVIIKSSGSGYFNTIELSVNGIGFGAQLKPVISNGQIIDVDIVSAGVGYASTNTTISIQSIGNDVKLKANLTSLTINDVEKYGTSDIEDGSTFGKNYAFIGNTYGVYFLNQKLKQYLNISSTPTSHSPIVGWAYDGCPIYGPFAYQNIDGSGGIVRMRSGYTYQSTIPSNYKFVEDYIFTNTGTLDKYNGRFCVTPEYPNGVYAYFCTLDNNNVPEYPYVIGPNYNFIPEEENFDLRNTQNLNFNNLNIVKWTVPYRVEDTKSKYEYFEFFRSPNKKDILIEQTSTGFVDSIKVIDGGSNYQINDSLVFDNEYTSGFGAIAKVSEISGVAVTSILSQSRSLSNVTFVCDGNIVTGIASTYHSLENGSYVNISGISTSSFETIEGFRKVDVSDVQTTLSANVGPSTITGIVTSIQVNSSLTLFDIDSQIKVDNEIMKVIGKDYKNNLLGVLRPASAPLHGSSTIVNLLPNKFTLDSLSINSSFSEVNQYYYFNSQESVSIGTSSGPGIGNTLTINPLGYGLPFVKYVPTGGIYLPNHHFNTGDKILYSTGTSTIVSNFGNLNTLSELYVIKIDSDVIGIVTTKSHISNQEAILKYTSAGSGNLHKFSTDKNIVSGDIVNNSCVVSTASTHGLSVGDTIKLNVISGVSTSYVVGYSTSTNRLLINGSVNPKIDVFYNDIVTFDLSSGSLSGKDFNLHSDKNFLNPYFGTVDSGVEVEKTSTQLVLTITEHTPNLYYYLSDSNVDESVVEYNQLNINQSRYNTESVINSVASKNFTINLNNTPERLTYNNSSDLSYSVLSGDSSGPISKVEIVSGGNSYKKLPKISSVTSDNGFGCNLITNSESIGKIQKTKVVNTQFICPSDATLKPTSKVFSAIKLTDNYTVKSLSIVSGGKNYINAPSINLYNRKENELISNFSATSTLKNSSINEIVITNPGSGLRSGDSELLFTGNTNGFKILNVSVVGSSPYTVTLTLKTPSSGFTTSNPLPVSVGDEVFIEGISASGNGFNSSDYNYETFTVTSVDPAYNSQDAATIEYELNSNPGSYNSSLSYNAYVTPSSYLPEVNVTLTQNQFFNNENVDSTEIIDNTNNNPITNVLKVKNSKNISVDDLLIGKSSSSKGTVSEITTFNSTFGVNSSVSETLGGKENRGYLSSNVQKLPDNNYYQKFSYSLKSKKSFEDWNSSVSDTSHIAGYKKFSDLSVESVGIGTTQSIKTDSSSLLNVVLNSYGNVNSIVNYDLVNEIDLEDNSNLYTEYLRFGRLRFGQSLYSTDNRVLSIDDISNLFNTEPISPTIIIDSNLISDSTVLKYQFYLTSSSSFLGELIYPEIFELLVTNNETINLTSYSYYFDFVNAYQNSFVGYFTANTNPLNSNEIILKFTPSNPFNTIDIRSIRESSRGSVGIATTSFGYVKNVEVNHSYSGIGSTVFYSISTTNCKSGTVLVGLSSITNKIEKSLELSFVKTENDIFVSQYAENQLVDLGSINVNINGSNLEFTYTGISGIGATVQANLKLITNSYAGYDSVTNSISKFASNQTISNSSSIGISTVSGIYGYTKYIIEIEQTVGVTTQRGVVQINSLHSGDYLNNIVYDPNGDIDLNDFNFETQYDIGGNNYTLYFNPITSANYKITTYESSLLSPDQ